MRKNDDYVIHYACENGCVKVENVKTANDWKIARGVPKRVPTRAHCVYWFIVPARGRLTRALVAVESRRPPFRDKRRHRNCFQTRPLQAYFKKVNISEVRGQLIRSNSRIYSTSSIYMLSVTDFEPKGTISKVGVHAGAKFGHTGCWSIDKCGQRSRRNCTGGFRSWPPTTCRFSTKRSFDHHGERNGNFV